MKRCIAIDKETGLTQYAKTLCQSVFQQPGFNSNRELLEWIKTIDLLLVYHNQVYAVDETVRLLSDDTDEMTLEQWLIMSSNERVQILFQSSHGDYCSIIRYVVSQGLITCEAISGYITAFIQEGNVSLFLCFGKFMQEQRLSLLLKQEVEQFASFFILHTKSTHYSFSREDLEVLLSLVLSILDHPLIPSDLGEQLQYVKKLLTVSITLNKEISISIPEIESIFNSEPKWCEEHPISFSSATVEEINEYLLLKSSQLLKDYYQQSHVSNLAIGSLRETCFSYLPSEIVNYILLPIMITENTLSSLNSASVLTASINNEWLNETVLRSVNSTILSMNVYVQ